MWQNLLDTQLLNTEQNQSMSIRLQLEKALSHMSHLFAHLSTQDCITLHQTTDWISCLCALFLSTCFFTETLPTSDTGSRLSAYSLALLEPLPFVCVGGVVFILLFLFGLFVGFFFF